ncbi:Aldo/keto reductase family-domain-containing protein [Cercophora newfieldiana]|uniref:Aldo/keto reductase family-domain-containing protein n=1 Tax=Cercophora newfieldiana TaxID=92897 RepID=A0AA39Y378_9PEZI|nr:Aldo/keto reductase family-domain-containing protein [Cercophora newfieldiana]
MPTPAAPPAGARPPLRAVLPPLILGTATFNHQYVSDPLSMPYRSIVARALSLGVSAFDTSPYYGPSETLLGTALNELVRPVPTPSNPHPVPVPRSSFALVTKAGRIAPDEFDYSPSWIRYSVLRSLERLHTHYVDLVYTHDCEFVTPPEVLAAVRELRRLRDEEGIVRYVGISGFPVDVLASLAEMILAETGEPIDAVLSYGHFTIQNQRLAPEGGDKTSPLARLKATGVDVVLNASILGMGLLTSRGIPADPEPGSAESESPLAKWHPSPAELRVACKKLAGIAGAAGERLESVAIRWSLEEWARVGAVAGVETSTGQRVGGTVCGVSSIEELEETVKEWRKVRSGLASRDSSTEFGSPRQEKVLNMVRNQMWPALGEWKDYVWESGGPDFVNKRRPEDKGVVPNDGIVAAHELKKAHKTP